MTNLFRSAGVSSIAATIIVWVLSQGQAKAPTGLALKRMKGASEQTKFLANDKLIVFKKEWDAAKFCNEATIDNPDMLEAYALDDAVFKIAILCPGSLDGEMNTVAVFSPSAPPRAKQVPPLPSSSRISDAVLNKTVQALIK